MREDKHIIGSISTYEDLNRESIIWFMQSSLSLLQQAITLDEITLRLYLPQENGYTSPPTETYVHFDEIPHDKQFDWISISGWKESNLQLGTSPYVINIVAYLPTDNRRAKTLEFSVSQSLLPKQIDGVLQNGIVSLLYSAFIRVKGITGYITVDYVSAGPGSISPYERTVGLSYPWASLDFREKTRGYYWGNFLHKTHVSLLGGIRKIDLPASIQVHPIKEYGYYIQLTDDLNNIDRKLLALLKAIFHPLLPTGYQQTPDYYKSLPDFTL